jgi:HPt (histidine-containing phosphotransfer) domain-containing protein
MEPLRHEQNQDIVVHTTCGSEWELLRLKTRSFDPAAVWLRVGGDMEFLRELVTLFVEEASQMLADMETSVEARDAAGLHKFSHKLRGAVLQFSASGVAATAAQLEEMGRTGSLEGSSAAVTQLKAETAELMEALQLMVHPGAAQ